MTEPNPQTMNGSEGPAATPSRVKLPELLDALSKGTVVTLIVIYGCGFLIVSLHNASYGVSEVSPLKPKILAAGTLFLLLTLIPIILARRLLPQVEDLGTRQAIAKATVAAAGYLIACSILAGSISILTAQATASSHGWSFYIPFLIGGAIFVGLIEMRKYASRTYEQQPVKTAVIIGVIIVFYLGFSIYSAVKGTPGVLTLWFFGVGVFGVLVEVNIRKQTEYDWTKVLGVVVSALAIFSTLVYPRLNASWGGGSPTPVILYFSGESRILPGQQLEANLLDESDTGIYVVKKDERQAIFIPHAAVSALYFSDKPLAPEFLKQAPKGP